MISMTTRITITRISVTTIKTRIPRKAIIIRTIRAIIALTTITTIKKQE